MSSTMRSNCMERFATNRVVRVVRVVRVLGHHLRYRDDAIELGAGLVADCSQELALVQQ